MKYVKPSLKLYANHLIIWFIFLLVFVPISGVAEKKPIMFSSVLAIIYIAIAYSTAWKAGFMDARKIQGYYPTVKTPVILSLITAVLPVILLVIYITVPNLWESDVAFLCGEADFFIGGMRFYNTPDCMFRLWFLNYGALIPNGNLFAYIIAVFILPVIIFAGYTVGTKRFKITEFIYAKAIFDGEEKSQNSKLRK